MIASQAVITGAFSVTQQAIQLGLLPRLEIRYTSDTGRPDLPAAHQHTAARGVLMLVVAVPDLERPGLGLRHRRDRHDGGHHLLAFVVVWKVWRWPLWGRVALIAPFLLIDLTFLGANLLKVFEGGWLPLLIGGLVMVVIFTWRRGNRLIFDKTRISRLRRP